MDYLLISAFLSESLVHRLLHSAKFTFAGQVSLLLLIAATFSFALWSRHSTLRTVRRTVALFSRAAGIPFYTYSAHSAFRDELSRARRYQRPLTVAIVKGYCNDRHASSSGMPMADGERVPSLDDYVSRYPLVGCILRGAIRESDLVMYDAVRDQYLLLLLELNSQQAFDSLVRLEEIMFERTGIRLMAGVAEYPSDALIAEDLIAKAESSLVKLSTLLGRQQMQRSVTASTGTHNGQPTAGGKVM
jgi:hypothetical protein